MLHFSTLFPAAATRRLLIGVVHLPALPGAPNFAGDMLSILDFLSADTEALLVGGVDGIIVENFGDQPFYGDQVPAHTVAALTRCTQAVCDLAGAVPVGVNVLRNDALAALGIVAATDARFVRINVHTGSAVTDQGVLEGRAAESIRLRQTICPQASILADVHVKHASPMGSETIGQAAADTYLRGMADGLVVSGGGTGHAPDREQVARARGALPGAPILLGSGLTLDNARELVMEADGAIVASSLKRDGDLRAPLDMERVRALAGLFADLGPAPFLSGGAHLDHAGGQ